MGKWPAEFDALPSEQQAELLAYVETKATVEGWYNQLSEDEAKKRDREIKRRGRG